MIRAPSKIMHGCCSYRVRSGARQQLLQLMSWISMFSTYYWTSNNKSWIHHCHTSRIQLNNFEHPSTCLEPPSKLLILSILSQLPSIPSIQGILSPTDAQMAVEAGVDGIMLSNHGGRQMDYAPSPIEMLPHVIDVIGHQVPLFVDGGIRRGTDVLKVWGFSVYEIGESEGLGHGECLAHETDRSFSACEGWAFKHWQCCWAKP